MISTLLSESPIRGGIDGADTGKGVADQTQQSPVSKAYIGAGLNGVQKLTGLFQLTTYLGPRTAFAGLIRSQTLSQLPEDSIAVRGREFFLNRFHRGRRHACLFTYWTLH